MRINERQLRDIIREAVIKCNEDFNEWKEIFNEYLSAVIDELQTDYLNQLGLKIKINDNYAFNGGKGRWLASYERQSQQIKNDIISIGINYPAIYKGMCKLHADKDEFNIEAQA